MVAQATELWAGRGVSCPPAGDPSGEALALVHERIAR
jgi:hypothetical protein